MYSVHVSPDSVQFSCHSDINCANYQHSYAETHLIFINKMCNLVYKISYKSFKSRHIHQIFSPIVHSVNTYTYANSQGHRAILQRGVIPSKSNVINIRFQQLVSIFVTKSMQISNLSVFLSRENMYHIRCILTTRMIAFMNIFILIMWVQLYVAIAQSRRNKGT